MKGNPFLGTEDTPDEPENPFFAEAKKPAPAEPSPQPQPAKSVTLHLPRKK